MAAVAAATEGGLAGGTLVEAALVGGMWAALVIPPCPRPCPTAIKLPAIDSPSGTGIEADSIETDLAGIGTDLAVTGSLEIGSPFLASASLTTIMATTTATRVYGPAGDGGGKTSAIERGAIVACQIGSPARRAGEFFCQRSESISPIDSSARDSPTIRRRSAQSVASRMLPRERRTQ